MTGRGEREQYLRPFQLEGIWIFVVLVQENAQYAFVENHAWLGMEKIVFRTQQKSN
jgi:hypothetical protein